LFGEPGGRFTNDIHVSGSIVEKEPTCLRELPMTDPILPNETLQSQLSAFVDDALPPAEIDLFTRRLVKDAELKQTMARYGLIGEAMRVPTISTRISRDFSDRITAALQQQEVTAASPEQSRRTAARWLKPAAGLAVAASVAWVAVLAVRTPTITNATKVAAETLQPVTLTAQRAASADSYVVPAAANVPSVAIPAARLTNYVVAHSEFSSPLGRHNMMTGLLTEGPSATEEAATVDTTSGP
jgi:negative regulator of sigma E activity